MVSKFFLNDLLTIMRSSYQPIFRESKSYQTLLKKKKKKSTEFDTDLRLTVAV